MEPYRSNYMDKDLVINQIRAEMNNFYRNLYPNLKLKRTKSRTSYKQLLFIVRMVLNLIEHKKVNYSVDKIIKTIIYNDKVLDRPTFLTYLLIHGNISFKERKKIAYLIYKKSEDPEILECLTRNVTTEELYEKVSSKLLMLKLNNN